MDYDIDAIKLLFNCYNRAIMKHELHLSILLLTVGFLNPKYQVLAL